VTKKIMVVDDDPLVLSTLRRLLEKKGYGVIAFKSAAEAVENYRSGSVDLILCDVRMPGMDGIDLIRRLRGQDAAAGTGRTPVVFVTGYADEKASAEAESLKADEYILKPFDLDLICSTIEKVIRK
jgi:CheY-like chemotaxis protein